MENAPIFAAHHHTALCVSHWETSTAFYKALGFTVENDWFWPEGVRNHKTLLRFRGLPDCWLEFFEFPQGKGKLTGDYRDAAGCVYRYALAVDSPQAVEDLFQYACSVGGAPVSVPEPVPLSGQKGGWSPRMATVAGPDGEHICFLFDPLTVPSAPPDGAAPTDHILGFHHNALHVSALDASIAFYEGMGFRLRDVYTEPGGGRCALLTLENGNGLFLREAPGGDLPSDTARMQAAGSLFQYCFSLARPEDVDRLHDRSIALGGRERIAPFWHEGYGEKGWVDHPAFTFGPDGEILEFLYINYRGNGAPPDGKVG